MTPGTHTISRDESKCLGCVHCCKACPTRAIRVRLGRAVIKHDLCLDCGECIRACPHDAVTARTSAASDLKRFDYTIAIPSTAIYSQFGRDAHPGQVAGALLQAGFDAFYDVSSMCHMVGGAIDTYLSECAGPWPKISGTCPAVVRLILLRYPDLIPHVATIESPRELTAKLARREAVVATGLAPDAIGVFYVTPCSAIMRSIMNPIGQQASYFDGAFSVAELYGPMLRAIKAGCRSVPEESFDLEGLRWGLTGGEVAGMRNANSLAVSGVAEVVRVFDSIEAGKFQALDFLEVHICPDGCIAGQLLVEERYEARHSLLRVAEQLAEQGARRRPQIDEKVRALYRERFFDLEDAIRAKPLTRAPQDLEHAILLRQEKERLRKGLPQVDCAACGAPDCATLAADVIAGEAGIGDCVILRLQELEQSLKGEGR